MPSPMSTAHLPPTAPPTIAPVWLLPCDWDETVAVVLTVTVAGGTVVDEPLGEEVDEGGAEVVDDEDDEADDGAALGEYDPEAVSSGKSGGGFSGYVIGDVPHDSTHAERQPTGQESR